MKRYFTDKATNVMKAQSDVYRYINPSKNTPHFYKLLDRDKRHLYFMQFRVVKIKTAENTYEYLITNLPHSFTMEDIKECYHWRWGIEISFRYLKHANGLLYFHSKKPEFLKQENATCFNLSFCVKFIIEEAPVIIKMFYSSCQDEHLYCTSSFCPQVSSSNQTLTTNLQRDWQTLKKFDYPNFLKHLIFPNNNQQQYKLCYH